MKKILFIIKSIPKSIAAGIMATASGKKWFILLLLSSNALAAPSRALLDAIRQVESGGRCVYGDNGKAYGTYQVHECVIVDVNRRYKTHYTLACRGSDKKSREICRLYLTMWGKGRSQIELARIWNGGPKGYLKSATLKYAQQIEKAMK